MFPAYVDTNLVGTGKISKAAILGLKGGVWAATTGFTVHWSLCIPAISLTLLNSHQISPAEQSAIVEAYNNADDIRAKGIVLAGQKHFTLSVIDRTIQGKKAVCSLLGISLLCF